MIAMLFLALTLFLCTLTNQVSAQDPAPVPDIFNVTLGPKVFFYNQLLDFSFDGTINPCNDNCTSAKTILAGTNGDPQKLCIKETVQSLLNCEQCMFTTLINKNQPMPDPRAGSTPVLQGYVTSCNERAKNIPLGLGNVTLVLPPTWDGPTGIFVPTIGLVFTVGAGVVFGISGLTLLSNM